MLDYTMSSTQEALSESLLKELNLSEKQLNEISDYIQSKQESNWKSLELVYLGEPKAQTRPRAVRRGNHISFYDNSKDIKTSLSNSIIQQLGPDFRLIEKEIFFECRYYRSYPKSFTKKEKVLAEMGYLRPCKKPDLDNYEKLVYDALKGVLFVDDGVVIKGNHEKFYSSKPRLEIKVWYLE